ncbi:zinc-ribbon domain-containing protein [Anoxybacillus flavithermus]|nr:zinc ribbon domain-containing protein [Anoxybacillus flavithermus]
MFCHQCGEKVSDQARFCPQCGVPLREGEQETYCSVPVTPR